MERLKVAIADKILELSSSNPEEMKFKLGKIQRFGDFAEACKTLMTKYPEIETELLEMVGDDDFDASRASRKVDAIISREHRLSNALPGPQVPQIPEEIPIITPPPADSIAENEAEADSPASTETGGKFDEKPAPEQPPFPDELSGHEEKIVYTTLGEESTDTPEKKIKRKKQLTLFWQVLAIAVAVSLLILLVKFVVIYWKTILIVLGLLLAIYLLWLFLKGRYRNKTN